MESFKLNDAKVSTFNECLHSSVIKRPPEIKLPSFEAPKSFPSIFNWLGAARSNALNLFPESCFKELYVEHKVAWLNLSIISDPDTIAEIFVNQPDSFGLCNLHLRILKPSLGGGLIVSEGDKWLRLRRASRLLINKNKNKRRTNKEFEPTIEQASNFASQNGSQSNFPTALSQFILNLVTEEILGHKRQIANDDITSAIEAHRDICEKVDYLDILGLSSKFVSLRMHRAKMIAASFNEDIEKEIKKSKSAWPHNINETEQRDFIINLLTGFESIWLTCLWSLLILAHYPALEKWIKHNQGESIDGSRLLMFVSEVLRMYPPLPLIYREPKADMLLPIGNVKKGQMLCISPYVVQRHRRLWDKPDVFIADRMKTVNATFPYMPFGVGTRRCVGADPGIKLITQVMSGLLHKHSPVSKEPFPLPRVGLSLRPQVGYDLRLELINKYA